MKQRKIYKHAVRWPLITLVTMALFFSSPAKPETSSSLTYGYKTYFRYHPPKEIQVRRNLYPFSGPVIRHGQIIPVCDTAKTAAAYAQKKDFRYMMQGKSGWLFRTSDFKTDFRISPEMLEYFDRLNKFLSSRGQTLVIAAQPPRAMAAEQYIDATEKPKEYTAAKARKGYKDFLRQLKDLNIEAVDLSDIPREISYYPKGDFHWNSEGARYSAQKIAEALKEIPAYKKLEKNDFVPEIAGLGPADRGAFEEFIQGTCKINIELTSEPHWTTAAKMPGTTAFPSVTIVGTSNSFQENKFNFAGFLKNFLRTDIYNAAIMDQRFGESSYGYYASDEYRKHPPKIIIWEFIPQLDINDTESLNAFRQIIPAVQGACSEQTAVTQHAGNITRPQTDIFAHHKIQSLKDTYLYLEVTTPLEREMKVEILYKDGNADQILLTRSARARNNGKYYLELGNDKPALLFRVITDKPQGQLLARLCKYPTYVAEK